MHATDESVQACANAMEKLAAGDLSVEIKAASDDDVLAISTMRVVEMFRKLVAEADMLRTAAIEGKADNSEATSVSLKAAIRRSSRGSMTALTQ